MQMVDHQVRQRSVRDGSSSAWSAYACPTPPCPRRQGRRRGQQAGKRRLPGRRHLVRTSSMHPPTAGPGSISSRTRGSTGRPVIDVRSSVFLQALGQQPGATDHAASGHPSVSGRDRSCWAGRRPAGENGAGEGVHPVRPRRVLVDLGPWYFRRERALADIGLILDPSGTWRTWARNRRDPGPRPSQPGTGVRTPSTGNARCATTTAQEYLNAEAVEIDPASSTYSRPSLFASGWQP